MKDGAVSQIGTSEELVASPADDYVREFTEDVPRYKVLSAGKVMIDAVSDNLAECPKVSKHAKLNSLLEIASETEGSLAVVCENNKIIGEINKSMILKAMNSKS